MTRERGMRRNTIRVATFSGPGARVAGLCSSVLLVVRAGATSLDHVRRAAAELDHPPVMLNRVTSSLPRWMNGMLGSAR